MLRIFLAVSVQAVCQQGSIVLGPICRAAFFPSILVILLIWYRQGRFEDEHK